MIFKAILRNNKPGYGQVTIPFPIPDSEYDHTIALLEDMDIGSPTAQDCRVDGLDGSYPILDQLVTQTVNVDELDYLAKRLDSSSSPNRNRFAGSRFGCRSSGWRASSSARTSDSRPWTTNCACPTSKTSSTLPSAASRQP